MTTPRPPLRDILLVTGMSGAGKSTVLNTLEDMGWEVLDNLPVRLIDRLLATPADDRGDDAARPLAIGIGAQTRDFEPDRLIRLVNRLRADDGHDIGTLFLDCAGAELERRYSETRRRHPLALDRPAVDGIAQERELLAPLRSWANRLIDTTSLSANELATRIRATFAREGLGEPTLSVMSFGFARGLPRDADVVLDMRFLRNPHWDEALRPVPGLIRRWARMSRATRPIPMRWRRLISSSCCCCRATGRRGNPMSRLRSGAPAGGTGRCMWPSAPQHGCARRDFRPRSRTAIWRPRRRIRLKGCHQD